VVFFSEHEAIARTTPSYRQTRLFKFW